MRKSIRVAALAAIVVAAGGAATAATAPPTGSTPVTVTAGAMTGKVNADLGKGLTLQVSNSTAGYDAAQLTVFRHGAPYRSLDTTDTYEATGFHYDFSGLPADTYTVCAYPIDPSLGRPANAPGQAGGCYAGADKLGNPLYVYFDGTHVPAGAVPIDPAHAPTLSMSNVLDPNAAGIAGKLTNPQGAGVAYATVRVLDRVSGQEFDTMTDSTGSYYVAHLPAAYAGPNRPRYSVCFDPHFSGQSSPLAPACYSKVPWNGGEAGLPADATPVTPLPGRNSTGISQVLQKGGAIAGSVVDASTHAPIVSEVTVFGGGGAVLESVGVGSKGTFRAQGLTPSANYRVCVNAGTAYIPQCWKNVAWDGSGPLPTGTTAVTVTAGATTSGIQFKLTPAPPVPNTFGTISGAVADLHSGKRLNGATVWVFTSAGPLATTATTDANGNYSVTLPASSSGYRICATDFTSTAPDSTATGWAPRCHGNVAWNGTGAAPTASPAVALAIGASVSPINVPMPRGGAIAGTMTVEGLNEGFGVTPGPDGVSVEIFTHSGQGVYRTDVLGLPSPAYQINGLAPGKYLVCFDGSGDNSLSQCYKFVAWDPGG